MAKCRNAEMPKWRNDIKDKSQSCKITVPLKLKLLFHWNLHLLPNIFSRLILTNKGKISGYFGFQSLSVNTTPRIFLNKMVAFCFDIGRKPFVYLVLTIEKRLWRYALSSSDYRDYQNGTHFAMNFIHDLWSTCTLHRNGVTLDVCIK